LISKVPMNAPAQNDRLLRFSVFAVDRESGELFKQGRKLKLQGQPFELLVALLEKPGEVLTRDELRQRVWPSDTAGDFDHGLNRAINKIREALGDSAESPHFIETLPRRGYRFIAPIQKEEDPPAQEPDAAPPEAALSEVGEALRSAAEWFRMTPPSAAAQAAKTRFRRTIWLLAGAAVAVTSSAAIWIRFLQPAARGEVLVQQLTTNSTENPVWQALVSPDGQYLAYADASGIQVRLISTGETHTLPRPQALPADDAWFPSAWFPDGTRLVASSIHVTPQGKTITAWSVLAMDGAATRLREDALAYSVSPDGAFIAYTAGSYMLSLENAINLPAAPNSEIWIMGAHGENARRVVAGATLTYFGSIRWSPDGKRIAYRKLRFANKTFAEYTLESSDLNGGAPSTILSSRHSYFLAGFEIDVGVAQDFCWTPDGRIVYMVPEPPPNYRDRNLWEIALDSGTGKPRGHPRRITNLVGFHMDSLSLTADGKKMAFESGSDQSQVYVGRVLPDGNLERPTRLTLDQRHNFPFDWTPDSKAVIFTSDRTGRFSIYKQALDQNEPELISTGLESTQMARVGPDRNSLIYAALSNPNFPNQSDAIRLMRVPLTGGAPQLIAETKTTDVNFDCVHRSGGLCVIGELSYDAKQASFSSVEPATGARRQLFRIALRGDKPLNWRVSPDGSRIAMTGASPRGEIEIRSLTGQIQTTIEVNGFPNMRTIDWAADGKTLLVSHPGLIGCPSGPIGATLLRVDLQGRARPLWQTRGGRYTWAIASPDGKYLALRGPSTERNAWMVENF
jgi:DNA-binding winged helix-turn-helix (wHTH) protein/Tol biopolymer transport system component